MTRLSADSATRSRNGRSLSSPRPLSSHPAVCRLIDRERDAELGGGKLASCFGDACTSHRVVRYAGAGLRTLALEGISAHGNGLCSSASWRARRCCDSAFF